MDEAANRIAHQRYARGQEFIGRGEAVGAIEHGLRVNRLILLHGPGGVGKSRLAIEVVRRHFRRLKSGAYHVSFDEVVEPEMVGLTVCAAMGIDPLGSSPQLAIETAFEGLPALLLLDNTEHLVDEVLRLSHHLLDRCPKLLVLITSRKLPTLTRNLSVYSVPPLALGADEGKQSEAAQLFIARARFHRASYSPLIAELNHIERVCAALDGLPLAIELVAAHVRSLDAETLSALPDLLQELASRTTERAPFRHQSLNASMEWTRGMCTELEQDAWARISAFEGPFTPTAAIASLDSGTDAASKLDLIEGLVGHALVRKHDQDGSVSFEMLKSIREYGRTLAGPEALDSSREVIADYAAQFCISAARSTLGPDQAVWSRRSLAELPTVRLGIEVVLLAARDQRRLFAMLTDAHAVIWWANGLSLEVAYWHRRVVVTDRIHSTVRAYSLSALGGMAPSMADLSSDELFSEAEKLSQSVDDPRLRLRVQEDRASSALLNGDFVGALILASVGVTQSSDTKLSVIHLNFLQIAAFAASALGGYAHASELARQMLLIVEPVEEVAYRSLALRILAISEWRQGDLEAARGLALKALEVATTTGPAAPLVSAAMTLFLVLESLGDDEQAAILYGAVDAHRSAIIGAYAMYAQTGETARALNNLQARLGAVRFEQLAAAGAVAPTGRLAELARGEISPADIAVPSERSPSEWLGRGPLTRREMEVSLLVARGYSNVEIASTLVISRRTVEGHIERTLRKLGLGSRTQLVAWMASHDNLP